MLHLELEKMVGSKITSIEFNFIEQRMVINCAKDINSQNGIEIGNVIIGYINNVCSKTISDFKMTSEIGVGFWSSLQEMNYKSNDDLTQVQIFLKDEQDLNNGAIEFVMKVIP